MEARSGMTTRRILVIDDSWETAETMRLVLETYGHTIAVAHTGESALTVSADFRPDVIFCDIGLAPGMDGFAVARSLRRQGADAYLIALTGYGGDDDKRRGREAGFDLYLTKPVSPGTLAALLDRLPGKARAGSNAA